MLTRKHHNRYEWRPVERKILLTYKKDVDRNILLQINDDDILIKTCILNKYTQFLCDNYFWESKIQQLLPGFKFPIEYDNKGRELYLIISNIDLFFERDENYNFESRYYQQCDYDYNANFICNNSDRDEISIANWSVKYRKPGLLNSMLDLGIHPDQNYINDAYNDYNIIKTSDIEDIYSLLPETDYILSLPNTGTPEILELLLPFDIIDIEGLLTVIFLLRDIESLQMIIDKEIYLTQDLINLGFIEDDNFLFITKVLIKNRLYPDDKTMGKLPKRQKSYIQKNIINKL